MSPPFSYPDREGPLRLASFAPFLTLAALAARAAAATTLAPESGLDAADFARLRREVLPAADERWRSIDWYTDVLAARDVAAGLGRPLFLWAMNGHPIGAS